MARTKVQPVGCRHGEEFGLHENVEDNGVQEKCDGAAHLRSEGGRLREDGARAVALEQRRAKDRTPDDASRGAARAMGRAREWGP